MSGRLCSSKAALFSFDFESSRIALATAVVISARTADRCRPYVTCFRMPSLSRYCLLEPLGSIRCLDPTLRPRRDIESRTHSVLADAPAAEVRDLGQTGLAVSSSPI